MTEPMKITTIYIPDMYLRMLDDLIDMNVYSDRSKIVRLALERFLDKEMQHQDDTEQDYFLDLLRYHPGKLRYTTTKKKDAPIPSKKTNNSKNYKFRQLVKPKKLYKIFPKELYFNYILSHLAETDGFIEYKKLGEFLGVQTSYTSMLVKKINKEVPGLIIYDKNSDYFGCKLNKKRFKQLLKKVNL